MVERVDGTNGTASSSTTPTGGTPESTRAPVPAGAVPGVVPSPLSMTGDEVDTMPFQMAKHLIPEGRSRTAVRDATTGSPSTDVRHRAFARSVVVGDVTSAAVAAVAVMILTAQTGWASPLVLLAATAAVAAGAGALWMSMLGLGRAYEVRYLGHGSEELSRVLVSGLGAVAMVAVAGWVLMPAWLAPVVLVGVLMTVLLSIVSRSMLRARLHRENLTGATLHRVLLVGDDDEVTRLSKRIHRNRYHGWHAVASAGPAPVGEPDPDSPVRLGPATSLTDVLEAARHCHADLVLLAPSGSSRFEAVDDLERALHAEGRSVALAPPMVEAVGPRVAVEPVCGLPVLHLSPPELGGPRRAVKSVADRAAASAALVLLLPLLLVVGLLVRLDSRGPAMFRQLRVGKDGKQFRIYKFRTMYVDAEERLAALSTENEGAGPLFKLKADPRVTRVGRFLRRTSLDELPQLLNVAIGDMSLVGPRPPLPREVAQYDPVTRRRLLVRPGITGLWQVHGRSDLSWAESTRLDVRYVENWSLGFDLSILVRTVRAVVQARGAY